MQGQSNSEDSGLKSESEQQSMSKSDGSESHSIFPLKRPVNLNFFAFHFPVTAWVSILHRLSGFFVFLLIPAFLWMLQESLASEARFQSLGNLFQAPILKGVLWLLLGALLYHVIAGFRHLLMDLHVGESKIGGRVTAWTVLLISVVGSVFLGVWLW